MPSLSLITGEVRGTRPLGNALLNGTSGSGRFGVLQSTEQALAQGGFHYQSGI